MAKRSEWDTAPGDAKQAAKPRTHTRRNVLIGVGAVAAAAVVGGVAAFGRCFFPGTPEAAPESDAMPATLDLESRIVTLNDGNVMPVYGIGTYYLTPDEAAESVYWAIAEGMRLIDTAHAYNNEEGVGRGIAHAIDEEAAYFPYIGQTSADTERRFGA